MPDPGQSNGRGRNETAEEKLDRNWMELLQELRVLQTGVQILAGFLLTLPFQARFETLTDFQRPSTSASWCWPHSPQRPSCFPSACTAGSSGSG